MIIPFLHFNNGKAADALAFYEKVFGAKSDIVTYKDMGAPNLSEAEQNYVAHAELVVFGCRLFVSDCPPGAEMPEGENFSISINISDKAELTRVYSELSEEGQIIHELSKTPWSDAYGMIKDKLNIIWQFNLE